MKNSIDKEIKNIGVAIFSKMWNEHAENMCEALNLNDKAIAQTSNGKLYPFVKQSKEVQKIWAESCLDVLLQK